MRRQIHQRPENRRHKLVILRVRGQPDSGVQTRDVTVQHAVCHRQKFLQIVRADQRPNRVPLLARLPQQGAHRRTDPGNGLELAQRLTWSEITVNLDSNY
uniref:(northern house mosquito) hypothetical protein n=1 Tax=Culex pipiens TaxID=7175 RepID=A0A8D8D920_CULPI